MKAAAKGELCCLVPHTIKVLLDCYTDNVLGKLVSSGNPTKPQKNISSSSKKARLNANAQKREQKRKETVADVKFFSTSSGGGELGSC